MFDVIARLLGHRNLFVGCLNECRTQLRHNISAFRFDRAGRVEKSGSTIRLKDYTLGRQEQQCPPRGRYQHERVTCCERRGLRGRQLQEKNRPRYTVVPSEDDFF